MGSAKESRLSVNSGNVRRMDFNSNNSLPAAVVLRTRFLTQRSQDSPASGSARSLLSPTTDINFSDTVTYVRGSHTFKVGGSITRNRIDQNARTTYAGNVDFSTNGNTRTTNQAFADALLGNFRTYSEQALDPMGFFRFTQYEGFVADSWKVTPRLSLELGVRYQFGQPIYTQANNLATSILRSMTRLRPSPSWQTAISTQPRVVIV